MQELEMIPRPLRVTEPDVSNPKQVDCIVEEEVGELSGEDAVARRARIAQITGTGTATVMAGASAYMAWRTDVSVPVGEMFRYIFSGLSVVSAGLGVGVYQLLKPEGMRQAYQNLNKKYSYDMQGLDHEEVIFSKDGDKVPFGN